MAARALSGTDALRLRTDAYSPRFKSKHKRQSFRLTRAAFRYQDGQLLIAKSNVGLTKLLVTSDGVKVGNPRYLKRYEK